MSRGNLMHVVGMRSEINSNIPVIKSTKLRFEDSRRRYINSGTLGKG